MQGSFGLIVPSRNMARSCAEKIAHRHAATNARCTLRPSGVAGRAVTPIAAVSGMAAEDGTSPVAVQHEQGGCRLLVEVAVFPERCQCGTRESRSRQRRSAETMAVAPIRLRSKGRRRRGRRVAVVPMVC